eukprot:3278969-Prymnesium_polylepis.1
MSTAVSQSPLEESGAPSAPAAAVAASAIHRLPLNFTGKSGRARASAKATALATAEAAWASRCCGLRPPSSTHALKCGFAAMAAASVAQVWL